MTFLRPFFVFRHSLAAEMPQEVGRLEKLLLGKIPYPEVTREVAQYNLDMAKWWVSSEPKWDCILNGTCMDTAAGRSRASLACGTTVCDVTIDGVVDENCWAKLWQMGPAGYWKAWKEFISQDVAAITPCNSALEYDWPPAV